MRPQLLSPLRPVPLAMDGRPGVDYGDPDRMFDWPTFGAGLRRPLADPPAT